MGYDNSDYADDCNGEDIGGWFAAYDAAAEAAGERHAAQSDRESHLSGKYVIVCRSKYNGKRIYYQDRALSKERFWTYFLSDAFGFSSMIIANTYCKRLKHNNPVVMQVNANGEVEPIIADGNNKER